MGGDGAGFWMGGASVLVGVASLLWLVTSVLMRAASLCWIGASLLMEVRLF